MRVRPTKTKSEAEKAARKLAKAANEKRRHARVKEAFGTLESHIAFMNPAPDRQMSKISILKSAIEYISNLAQMIENHDSGILMTSGVVNSDENHQNDENLEIVEMPGVWSKKRAEEQKKNQKVFEILKVAGDLENRETEGVVNESHNFVPIGVNDWKSKSSPPTVSPQNSNPCEAVYMKL